MAWTQVGPVVFGLGLLARQGQDTAGPTSLLAHSGAPSDAFPCSSVVTSPHLEYLIVPKQELAEKLAAEESNLPKLPKSQACETSESNLALSMKPHLRQNGAKEWLEEYSTKCWHQEDKLQLSAVSPQLSSIEILGTPGAQPKMQVMLSDMRQNQSWLSPDRGSRI